MSSNNSNTFETNKSIANHNIKRLRHLLCAVVLIIIDQISKYYARLLFMDGDSCLIIPNILRFVFHDNTGAMWGIFSDSPHSVLYLTIITLVILSIMIIVYFRIPDDKKYAPLLWVVVFVFAGAIGNLIDRICFNYVTDFIKTEFIDFPVFNIADCYITVSVFVLCYLILFKYSDNDLDFLSIKKSEKNKK